MTNILANLPVDPNHILQQGSIAGAGWWAALCILIVVVGGGAVLWHGMRRQDKLVESLGTTNADTVKLLTTVVQDNTRAKTETTAALHGLTKAVERMDADLQAAQRGSLRRPMNPEPNGERHG